MHLEQSGGQRLHSSGSYRSDGRTYGQMATVQMLEKMPASLRIQPVMMPACCSATVGRWWVRSPVILDHTCPVRWWRHTSRGGKLQLVVEGAGIFFFFFLHFITLQFWPVSCGSCWWHFLQNLGRSSQGEPAVSPHLKNYCRAGPWGREGLKCS